MVIDWARRTRAFESWFAENPLRIYRAEFALSRKVVAHVLNVHDSTIKNWESGLGEPKLEHFRVLDGKHPEVWAREWAAWLEAKPSLERKTA